MSRKKNKQCYELAQEEESENMNIAKRRLVVSFITIIALVVTMVPTLGLQSVEAAAEKGTVITKKNNYKDKYWPLDKIEYTAQGDGTYKMKLTFDLTVYSDADMKGITAAKLEVRSGEQDSRWLADTTIGGISGSKEFSVDVPKPVKEGETFAVYLALLEDGNIDDSYGNYTGFAYQYFQAPDATGDIFDSMEGYILKECTSENNEEYEEIFVEFKAQVKSGAGNYLYAFNKADNGLYGISSTTNTNTVSALIYKSFSSNPIDFTGKKSDWVLIAAPDKDTAKAWISSITSNGNGKNLSMHTVAHITNEYMPKKYEVTQSSSRYDKLKVTVNATSSYNPAHKVEVYNYTKGVGEGSLHKTFTFSEEGTRAGSFTVTGLKPGTTKYYSVHLIKNGPNGLRYTYIDGRWHAPKSASFKTASVATSVKLSANKARIVVKVPGTQAATGLSTMYVYKGSKKIKTLKSNGKTTLAFIYKGSKASSSKYKVVSVCPKKTSIKTTSAKKAPKTNTYKRNGYISGNIDNITKYGTARFVPWQTTYYDGKIKVTGYIANNRVYPLKTFKFKVTVKNNGSSMGSKTVTYNNIKKYAIKKVTITIKTKKTPDFVNNSTEHGVKYLKTKW